VNLALQLVASLVLIVAATLIHGTGVALTSKLFHYEEDSLKDRRLASREFQLMVPMALCLFGLHTIEITMFALFYMGVGAIGTLEQALYYSASAYTTLGPAGDELVEWRLVGAFEGLTGFVLIGWSVAVFVTDMEKVLRGR
jgi:hypothetical protein